MKTSEKIKYALGEGGVALLLKRAWRKLKKKAGFIHNVHYRFNHAMPRGFPRAEVEPIETHATDEDVLIAERVLAAFRRATENEKLYANRDEDMWSFLEGGHHKDFLEILHSNDPHRLADYLRSMYRQSITYGISNAVEYNELVPNKKLRRYEAADIKDKLVSFAEVLGVLPYESPVQENFGENIYTDPNLLAKKIEEELGIEIAPPNIDGGVFKLKMGGGYFIARDVLALYTAWRMRQLVRPESASLCEIGAGVGKVTLYTTLFGFSNYSIFDLPRMNVVQAWYLIKALPQKEIFLYGENAGSKNAIKILPWWEFMDIRRKVFDLTLNEDGFPEMDKSIVTDYLDAIKKNTKRYFLSINHERGDALIPGQTEKLHLVVSQAVKESGGFKRVYRFPQPLRKDYVEELYEVLS